MECIFLLISIYYSITITMGWWWIGIWRDFAMKQNSFALVCHSLARFTCFALLIQTVGYSVILVNCPAPDCSSVIIPMGWSSYLTTWIPDVAQKCKYQSIWQLDIALKNRSSGLCFVGSPKNSGSEEPKIDAFFGMLISKSRW